MQIVMHILAKPSFRGSLRTAIIEDLETWECGLDLVFEKKKGRKTGWAKIKAKGCPGAINIHWDQHSKTLIGRAVSRKGNCADKLVGLFVEYLLCKRGKSISALAMRTI